MKPMRPWSILLLAAAASIASAADYFMYVGTYTGPRSKGIYLYRFQPDTGTVTSLGLAGETQNPSFLAIHPSGNFLYSADETDQGMVSAFKIDRKTGKLTLLNRVSSHGSSPCAIEVDPSGRNLFVANYGNGSVALMPIGQDGRLAEASFVDQHKGSGADKSRQEGPHAHSTDFAPGNRFALSSDLGLDKVFVYRFAAADHTLAPNTPAFGATPPASGPRGLLVPPSERQVRLWGERAELDRDDVFLGRRLRHVEGAQDPFRRFRRIGTVRRMVLRFMYIPRESSCIPRTAARRTTSRRSA